MAQLMSALIGVLNETLKESAIAFYKLNKAYSTLEKIMQMEENYLLKNKKKNRAAAAASKKSGMYSIHHPFILFSFALERIRMKERILTN